jgi:hypothetical protein
MDYGKETEKPKVEEETFIIGIDDQKYQTQIEINTNK